MFRGRGSYHKLRQSVHANSGWSGAAFDELTTVDPYEYQVGAGTCPGGRSLAVKLELSDAYQLYLAFLQG